MKTKVISLKHDHSSETLKKFKPMFDYSAYQPFNPIMVTDGIVSNNTSILIDFVRPIIWSVVDDIKKMNDPYHTLFTNNVQEPEVFVAEILVEAIKNSYDAIVSKLFSQDNTQPYVPDIKVSYSFLDNNLVFVISDNGAGSSSASAEIKSNYNSALNLFMNSDEQGKLKIEHMLKMLGQDQEAFRIVTDDKGAQTVLNLDLYAIFNEDAIKKEMYGN